MPTNLTLRPSRPQDTPKEVTRGLTTRRWTLFVEREELRPLPSISTRARRAPASDPEKHVRTRLGNAF